MENCNVVVDILIPGPSVRTSRGTEHHNMTRNTVYTLGGVVGPNTIIPESAFQEYDREALVESLLETGRIKKCGSYSGNMLNYDAWLVNEAARRMKKETRELRASLGKIRIPRTLAETAKAFGYFDRIHVGDRVFRVTAPLLSIGSSGQHAQTGDEVTTSMVHRTETSATIESDMAEPVGTVKEVNAFAGIATVEYFKGMEPKEEDE